MFSAFVDGLTGRDGAIGVMAAIIMISVISIFAALIVYGVIYAIDNIGVEPEYGEGVVVKREFIPEHTDTTYVYNSTTKVSTPVFTHYPDEWKVYVDHREEVDWVSVSSQFYHSVSINTKVHISFVTGRLTSGFYLKTVELLE